MWFVYSLKVLCVITYISSGSTFIIKNDKIKRDPFSDLESKSKDVNVTESKKPIIIGFKKASDVEGLYKFLSQFNEEVRSLEPKEYHEKSGLDLLHKSQTEFPQIFNTQKGKISNTSEYVFYPLKNVYFKGLEEPLNLNSIAIKVHDPSFKEKLDNISVNYLLATPNKTKSEVGNKSNEIMTSNSNHDKCFVQNRRKYKLCPQKRSKTSLTLLDIWTTEDSNAAENALNKISNVSESQEVLLKKSFKGIENKSQNRMMKNFIFEKPKSDVTKCDSCTFSSNLIEFSSLNTSTTTAASNFSGNPLLFSASTTQIAPSTLTILKYRTSATSSPSAPYITFKETIDPNKPWNLQIMLQLKINNRSINVLPSGY